LSYQTVIIVNAGIHISQHVGFPREALINSGLMKQPFKMREFKANIVSNSTAIAKIFDAEIAYFGCWSANHELISTSLDAR